MLYLAAFGASFLYIGLKAMQQLNVVHGQFMAVVPTSFAMAACEAFIVVNVARSGFNWWLVFAIGLGGGLGCIASMWIHKRFRK